MKRVRFLGFVLSLSLLTTFCHSLPAFAITITQATGANYLASAALTGLPAGATGTVSLNPAMATHLNAPAAGSTILTTFAAEAAAQFPGWTAVSGAALSGSLVINTYKAHDYGTARGGADMNATFTPGGTDPTVTNLRFIQLFSESGTGLTAASHIDPFPNDDTLPWYYTEAETTANSTATTTTFKDFPSDPVSPIPFSRSIRFETYLASFNTTTNVATIRDGWSWGYDIVAVPEPSTALMVILGLLGLTRRRSA